MKFEFKESQLLGDQEMLLQTLAGDSFKCSKERPSKFP